MTHYIDIRLRPDPEFIETQLMNALYSKLHRALVQLKSDHIGVSFPLVNKTLGGCMRLHSTAPRLQALLETSWLSGMSDHITLSEIAFVPEKVQHRIVRRVQVHSNPERKRARYLRRHDGVFLNDDEQLFLASHAKQTDLPFVVIRSQSTGQQFRLFVEHGLFTDTPQDGLFNTYGLSSDATIAWF